MKSKKVWLAGGVTGAAVLATVAVLWGRGGGGTDTLTITAPSEDCTDEIVTALERFSGDWGMGFDVTPDDTDTIAIEGTLEKMCTAHGEPHKALFELDVRDDRCWLAQAPDTVPSGESYAAIPLYNCECARDAT